MLRLLVLRHAKAAPHDDRPDRERPLVARGREDAGLIGRAMRAGGHVPQLVLCSPATRTVETWEAVAAVIGANPAIAIRETLYDAAEETILACLRDVQEGIAVILYVGHNPGLERFVRRMLRSPDDAEERRRCTALAREFPTSALAVIDFGVAEWAQIEPATGTLSDVLTPADYKGG